MERFTTNFLTKLTAAQAESIYQDYDELNDGTCLIALQGQWGFDLDQRIMGDDVIWTLHVYKYNQDDPANIYNIGSLSGFDFSQYEEQDAIFFEDYAQAIQHMVELVAKVDHLND